MSEAQPVNVQQALAEVGNLVRMFKGVRDAETVIATLANAEQVLAETRKATTTAKSALTRAQNEVEDAKTEAARIRDEAAFERAAAVADRERILADAKAEAERMIAAAAADRAAADAEIKDAKRELDGLVQKAGIVRGELGRLEASRAAVLAALTGAQERATDVPPVETP